MFWDSIAELSRCTPEALEAHARTLPLDLLDLARRVNPVLAPHTRELDRLRAHLAEDGVRQGYFRDPEVYYPVFSLIDRAVDDDHVSDLLRRLRRALGLVDLRSEQGLADGYYRQRLPRPALYEVRAGELREVTEPLLTGVDGLAARVWLPHQGLFNDILDPDVYPPCSTPPEPGWLLGRLERALSILRSWSLPLVGDLDRAVTTIVLLPDWPEEHIPEGELRWSYNLRFRYFGGIFLNLFRTDELGIAEGLLHEYCHQRMWHWWELEKPSGVPSPEAQITSPVTGTTKAACVMVHALLIYTAAEDLYRQALEGALPSVGPVSPFARRRAARLHAAIPVLHERLREHVPPGTVIRAFIDGLRDRHALPWRYRDGSPPTFVGGSTS